MLVTSLVASVALTADLACPKAYGSMPCTRFGEPPRMLASDGGGGGCKYGSREYWDGMYRGSGQAAADGLPAEAYSWYCGWAELEPFWRELVPDERASVLIPGVGNDRAVAEMYESGYTALTAFDYSQDAVERAAALFAPRPITLLRADATALPFRGERLFDAALDKGALDAIGIHSVASLRLAASELARVVRPGGVVLSVSRALDEEVMLGAFANDERWEVLRDGGLYLAESGEVSTDLAASLYAWRRR
jgi:SAM-dependent methyltransferase